MQVFVNFCPGKAVLFKTLRKCLKTFQKVYSLKHNLESIDEISAVPEGVTKGKLFLTSAWKQSVVMFQMLTAIGHPQTSYLSIDQHFLQVQVDSVHHHWKSLTLPAFNPGIIFSKAEARERHYVLIMERLFSDHGFHQVHKALKGIEYLQHTKYLLYTMIQYDS